MVLIVDLAARVEARNVRRLVGRRAGAYGSVLRAIEVDPQAAHRVVHGREDAHRIEVRVFADEPLVDLEHAGELLAKQLARQMRHVEIDLVLVLAALGVVDASLFVEAPLEELAARNVARDEIAVRRILLFEEVVARVLGNVSPRPMLLRIARHPHAPSLAPNPPGDYTGLVRARYRPGMHLHDPGPPQPRPRLSPSLPR